MHQNASFCNVSTAAAGSNGALPKAAEPQLSLQKLKVIALLVGGHNFIDAADVAGVDRTTVYRWRRDPQFAAELAAQVKEAMSAVKTRMGLVILRATTVVDAALHSRDDAMRNLNAFRVINSRRVWEIGSTGVTR